MIMIEEFSDDGQASYKREGLPDLIVPARPLRYPSIWSDIRDAWMVLTNKAEAVQWPEQRHTKRGK